MTNRWNLVTSLTLTRSEYYAPTSILTMDNDRRIVDFNVVFELLLGAAVEGLRYQPIQRLLDQVGQRLEGPVFGPLSAPPADRAGDITVSSPMEHTHPAQDYVDCRYRSETFGMVDLRRTVLNLLDLNTGRPSGTTVIWEILQIQRDREFREALRREWNHRLVWETYAVSYDRVLPELPFYQEVLDRHAEAMASPGIVDVIDLGAGTGNLATRLLNANRRVTVVDLSRAMLDKLRAKLPDQGQQELTLLEQNAEHLPQLSDESFDGVTILLALYDMNEPLAALHEAARVLKPGGTLVITEPKDRFDLQALLDFTDAFLAERGLADSLKADWDRVVRANLVLDPSTRQARLPAEKITEFLQDRQFVGLAAEDSHLGNCATVRGKKPHRP